MSRANEEAMLGRLGKNLWWLRTQRRLSQEALAERSEIHRTYISLIENSMRSLHITTTLALSGALEVPVGMFLDGISFSAAVRAPGAFVVEPFDPGAMILKPRG